MAQNLSVPLAFAALLHLANEKVSAGHFEGGRNSTSSNVLYIWVTEMTFHSKSGENFEAIFPPVFGLELDLKIDITFINC